MEFRTEYLRLHFIVFLWGFTAILGLLISIPAVEMVLYRTFLAALGMGLLMLVLKTPFAVSSTDLIRLLLTGIIVGAHWLCFFASGKVSNASVSLVGFATGSLWTAFLEPLTHGKKIQTFEVVLGGLVVLGLYIIFSFDFRYPLGLALGVTSGFTAAVFGVINSKMVRRVHPYAITFYEMIGAFLTTALFLPFYKVTWASEHILRLIPTGLDWLWLFILAWVCTVYAYSEGVALMKKLSAFMVQLTINLEPVYGILMALAVFGSQERMRLSFYLGTLVIISSVFSYPLLKSKLLRDL